MAVKSKSFVGTPLPERHGESTWHLSDSFQITLVFPLIMVAAWTMPGYANTVAVVLAVCFILWFSVHGRFSFRELGLEGSSRGTGVMFVSAALIVIALVIAGFILAKIGPSHPFSAKRSILYAIWALLQEFILQSFFYLRLESLFGGRRAVWVAALLFALPHIPSPILTALSFVGGLYFCELFRRHRNLYPLGLVHAAIGLTIAASLPDRLLHHMRVGIGYLAYHP